MDQVYVGMTAEDTTGSIGVVEAVEDDPTTGTPQIVVQRDDGGRLILAPGMYLVVGDVLHIDEIEEREVGLTADPGTSSQSHASMNAPSFDPLRTQELPVIDDARSSQRDLAQGEELRIPVIREEAVVRTREVERGGVRVHKTVNEREEVVEQPTFREQVDVERIPIGRVVPSAPDVREEGDTLIIPVMEEMLVVEKRLILKEEIRITRRWISEIEQARVVLSEENVTIEQLNDRSVSEQLQPNR